MMIPPDRWEARILSRAKHVCGVATISKILRCRKTSNAHVREVAQAKRPQARCRRACHCFFAHNHAPLQLAGRSKPRSCDAPAARRHEPSIPSSCANTLRHTTLIIGGSRTSWTDLMYEVSSRNESIHPLLRVSFEAERMMMINYYKIISGFLENRELFKNNSTHFFLFI